MKKMVMVLCLGLFLKVSAFAGEISECYFTEGAVQAFADTQLYNEYEGVVDQGDTSDWSSDIPTTVALSKKTCDNLDVMQRVVEIVSVSLNTAGSICVKSRHPVVTTAGAVLMIGGAGIQTLNVVFRNQYDECQRQKIEEQIRDTLKDYLKNKGALVR